MAKFGRRKLVVFIAVYGLLPAGLVLSLLAGWVASVENSTLVLQSADSPDGRYRAEVVREDPGVSSSYKYMVRVMAAGLPPIAKGLHMLPFGPVDVALDVEHEPDKLTLNWSGPRELTIRCEGCGGAAHGNTRWRAIEFRYALR